MLTAAFLYKIRISPVIAQPNSNKSLKFIMLSSTPAFQQQRSSFYFLMLGNISIAQHHQGVLWNKPKTLRPYEHDSFSIDINVVR